MKKSINENILDFMCLVINDLNNRRVGVFKSY